jgi:hypothetical protein
MNWFGSNKNAALKANWSILAFVAASFFYLKNRIISIRALILSKYGLIVNVA